MVNGIIAKIGGKVCDDDVIKIDGDIVKQKKIKKTYIAFNKPAGIVCTTDTKREKNNIIDFINFKSRIFPIGRLDKESEGLILLTDDGDIVNKILRSSNNHEKEYIVWVNKPISQTFIKRMSEGVPILNTMSKPCVVQKITNTKFKIVLTQGLNRQIRRMCNYMDYDVVKLQRIRIININLKSKLGEYRQLTADEINNLNHQLKNSKQ